MAGLFGMRGAQHRTGPGAVELALDMTTEAITLYERAASGGWRKFAGAPLDDPEFQIVIGLVRSEAEQHNGRRPVRLWLPREQVLQRRTRLAARNPDARLAEAFGYIAAETVFRPEDVALAVSPDEPDGEATILITFAETWREARTYAERWGFLPGEVSTRHRAGAFGAEGPVFHLRPARRQAPVNRRKLGALAASAGLGAGAAAAAASIWMLLPIAQVPEAPAPAPEASANVTEVLASPSAAPGAAPLPATRPSPDPSLAGTLPAVAPAPGAAQPQQAAPLAPAVPSPGHGGSSSLPEPVLSAVMRTLPNAAPVHRLALNDAEAAVVVQVAGSAPVQMAPWANLPKAPRLVAEALAPRPPLQPDPALGEPERPPAAAPAQLAAFAAPSAAAPGADDASAFAAAGEAALPPVLRPPAAIAPAGPAPAAPPAAPETEPEPIEVSVTIFPPGATRLPVPLPPFRPGPSTSKLPVVAGPPDALAPPAASANAEIGMAAVAAHPAVLLQPDAMVPVAPALAGPPAAPFAEAAPPVVTIFPPDATRLPVPMPPVRPGPSTSKVPVVAGPPATPAAPGAPQSAAIETAATPPDPAVIRPPDAIAPVAFALAGPPAAPVTEADPPVVTILPPDATRLPVPVPPARPGSTVPQTSAPPAAAPGQADRGDPSQPEPEQLTPQPAVPAVDLGADLAGLTLPPRRPTGSAGTDAAPAPAEAPAPSRFGALAPVAPVPPPAAATAPPAAATAPPVDPDAPTELAALSSPRPPIRPDRPLVPVKLPSATLLPVLGGTASAKVRSAATEPGIPLDQTALIGVLNLDGGRKALLRMPDGRYKSVIVGDEVDGWRVRAIGVDAMKVSRSGQDRTLQLVNR